MSCTHEGCAVITIGQKLVGILTEHEIICGSAAGLDFATTTVSALMQPDPLTCTETEIRDLSAVLVKLQQQRCLPVVNQQQVIGVVTPESINAILQAEYYLTRQNPQIETIADTSPFYSGELHQLMRLFQQALHDKTAALEQEISQRQQLTQALAESKKRYCGILNHLPDPVCCFQPDGKITFANRAYCEHFHRPLESILGQNFLTLLPAAEQSIWLERLQRLAQTKGSITYEQAIRSDNQSRWMQWTDCAICDEAGNLLEFQAIGRDITERKQAEVTLQHSEARQRAILDAIPDLLLRVKRDGSCLDCILPASDREPRFLPVQNHIREVLPPEALQQELELIERALLTGELQLFEHRFVKHGQVSYEEVRAVPCGDQEVLFMVRDVTRRRQSETQFQRLTENVPGVVYRYVLGHSGEDYMTYLSPRCREIFEVEAEAILQDISLFWSLLHPEDVARMRQMIAATTTLQPGFTELRILTPSGLRWIQVFSQPERQPNGDIVWDGLMIDVTASHQAHVALQASEARFRAIFEQAAVGITQATLEGQYLQVNQRFCELLGYSEAELLASTIEQITHPEDWLANQESIHQLISGQVNSIAFEKRYLCKDGQLRWVYITASLVQDGKHQRRHLLSIVENIQKRKQAESDLQAQQVFLRSVIDAVDSSIFVKDAAGQFLTANQAAGAIYGVSADQLIGKTDADFNSNLAQVEEFWATNHQVMHSRRKVVFTEMLTNPQGKDNWYHTTISPFINTAGEIEGIIGVAADVSDLKQVEEALRQSKESAEAANLAKSQFLANMSHELRTPLNSILGFTQLLSHDSGLKPEQRQQLGIILRSGEHLLGLINDVLEMSKIDAGRIALSLTSCNLHQLLDNLQEMMQLKAITKGLKLIVERPPNLPRYICADQSKLRQVLLNLVGNAIKFTIQGQVTLRIRAEEGSTEPTSMTDSAQQPQIQPILRAADAMTLYFAIEDTGPGIDPADFSSLFNPFVQTATGQQSPEGTGLGLGISRRFVELMGGQISVTSRQGQGATFEFSLPTCSALPDLREAHSYGSIVGLAAPLSPYRILVVEDQTTNRKLVVQLLTKLGFDVQEAVNGAEAFDLWQQWLPHLILLDMRMPIMNGYEVTAKIREDEAAQLQRGQSNRPCRTVIVALTASAFEEERTQILAAGCDGYILKPFKSEDLLSAIASHLQVNYIYAEAGRNQTQLPEPILQPAKILAEAMQELPTAWKQELHQAAVQLDSERCTELVQQVPLTVPLLVERLMELVSEFRFDVLIDLTQPQHSV